LSAAIASIYLFIMSTRLRDVAQNALAEARSNVADDFVTGVTNEFRNAGSEDQRRRRQTRRQTNGM